QRGELDAKKQLAPLERCLEEIGEETVERDAPFGEPGLRDGDAVESKERDRRILRRVGVCEIPTEGGLLADPHRRDCRERRLERLVEGFGLEVVEWSHRASRAFAIARVIP